MCQQSTQRENKLPGMLTRATTAYTIGRVMETVLFWSIASVKASRWDSFLPIIHKWIVDPYKPAGSYHEHLARKPRGEMSSEKNNVKTEIKDISPILIN